MDEFAIEGRRFTFFASYYNALRGLDDVRRLKLYDAISSYGIAAQEPLFDDPICKAIFEALRPNIENSLKAHEGGKKGGQSKGKNKPNPPSNPPSNTPSNPPSEFYATGARSKRREGEEGEEREEEFENENYPAAQKNDTEKGNDRTYRAGAVVNSEREKPLDWRDLSRDRLH